MIQRDLYLHQLVSYMWDGQIKVITGIRRCGKSVLLFELFRDYLLSQGTSAENIITIELDKRKDVKYRSPIALGSMVRWLLALAAHTHYRHTSVPGTRYHCLQEQQGCWKTKLRWKASPCCSFVHRCRENGENGSEK